jgi:hypothetical protein
MRHHYGRDSPHRSDGRLRRIEIRRPVPESPGKSVACNAKLNVGAVLEGSVRRSANTVRRSANTVRVTTQLIKAVTGFHVWSKAYDRDLGEVTPGPPWSAANRTICLVSSNVPARRARSTRSITRCRCAALFCTTGSGGALRPRARRQRYWETSSLTRMRRSSRNGETRRRG